MGVVDEAVEDGVGIGWVADDLVPFVDRDLAGQDGRAAAVSFPGLARNPNPVERL